MQDRGILQTRWSKNETLRGKKPQEAQKAQETVTPLVPFVLLVVSLVLSYVLVLMMAAIFSTNSRRSPLS